MHQIEIMIGRIIVGVILVIVGPILTIKAEWFFTQFGRIPFAEKYLGLDGGTRLFYRLLGIALVILGLVIMTGDLGRGVANLFS